ncbi:MAG TPA: ATP-binding cassette domain-containing protein [Candidatus Marinimicrobia bacterium]|nr:ATP-binding cassette domain-containing protein [Candidatus Neomarinimicrobiota bacterium]
MINDNIIEIGNLEARYGDNIILKNVNAVIPRGKISVILGTSGCGKTTLLKNIVRLYEPYSGTIKIFGQETVGMDPGEFKKILKKVGMLFQNGALLNSISIFDNVAIPIEQHTNISSELIEAIVNVKLNLVHLGHAIHRFPSELSGGMKKRAALARAIALDPEILFCDEPSAGLDPLTSASLDELILNLKKQLAMTIVIVTHELASIHRIADNIIFLEKGEAIFCGSLADALKADIPSIKTFFEAGRF